MGTSSPHHTSRLALWLLSPPFSLSGSFVCLMLFFVLGDSCMNPLRILDCPLPTFHENQNLNIHCGDQKHHVFISGFSHGPCFSNRPPSENPTTPEINCLHFTDPQPQGSTASFHQPISREEGSPNPENKVSLQKTPDNKNRAFEYDGSRNQARQHLPRTCINLKIEPRNLSLHSNSLAKSIHEILFFFLMYVQIHIHNRFASSEIQKGKRK